MNKLKLGVTKTLSNWRIEQAEQDLMKLPQAPCPVVHRFGPGIYIREVSLPAGALVIGHHHNFEHMNVLVKGKLTLRLEDGEFAEISAPFSYVAGPGRKIAYVHEDAIWLNVFSTNETNVENLEAHFLTKSQSFEESARDLRRANLLLSGIDQNDFQEFLKEFGLTDEYVRKISENEDDQGSLPFGSYKIKVGNSVIEGKGVFATSEISSGEIIAPARIDGKRTIVGRFTNHSVHPNAKMIRSESPGDIDLIATKKISGCHGGLDGEEITINYREALRLTMEMGVSICQP